MKALSWDDIGGNRVWQASIPKGPGQLVFICFRAGVGARPAKVDGKAGASRSDDVAADNGHIQLRHLEDAAVRRCSTGFGVPWG